jgi:hypothetical protein
MLLWTAHGIASVDPRRSWDIGLCPPCGLVNHGNTCYFNSTIQLLCSLSAVRKLAHEADHFCTRLVADPAHAWEFIYTFERLWRLLGKMDLDQRVASAVTKIKERTRKSKKGKKLNENKLQELLEDSQRTANFSMRKKEMERNGEWTQETTREEILVYSPRLSPGVQEDALAFLLILLDRDYVPYVDQKPEHAPYVHDMFAFGSDFTQCKEDWVQKSSPLERMCARLKVGIIRCDKCQWVSSEQCTPWMIVGNSLTLAHHEVEGFLRLEESIEKLNKKCEKCQSDQDTPATQITKIYHWPSVLLIGISRETGYSDKQDSTFIPTPLFLCSKDNRPAYRLSAVVHRYPRGSNKHQNRMVSVKIPGTTKTKLVKTRSVTAGNNGHYTTTVVQWNGTSPQSPPTIWYCDDALVQRIHLDPSVRSTRSKTSYRDFADYMMTRATSPFILAYDRLPPGV